MANYNVTDYDSLKTGISTANGTTANDNLVFQNNLTLSATQTIDLFNIPANAGTLRFRSQQPTPAVDPPVFYTLTVTSALNIADNTPATAQPSFTIGPFKLQLGDGTTNASIAGNLRVDDGGVLIFNNTTDTTYTGTLTIEDEDNSVLNNVAGTTVTFDGSASTTNPVGVAIRASQGTGAASSFELELGGDGDGVISGIIADGGLAAAPGSFEKTGDGTWTFSGTNTYVGTTTVDEGTLVIRNSSGLGAVIGAGAGSTAHPATAAAAGTIVSDGATLSLETLTDGPNLTIGAEDLTIAGEGAPGDDPGEDSAGALSNELGANSFAGNIHLAEFMDTASGPVAVAADATIKSEAGSLTLMGTIDAPAPASGAAAPVLTLDGDGNGAISGNIASSIGSIVKEGSGSWALSGTNAYAGGSTIDEGTLELGTLSSAGTGGITFGDEDQNLQLDVSGTLTNTIASFEEGDGIDLRTINSDGATYTLTDNTLTVTETAANGGDSNTLTFDELPDGYSFVLGSDGNGGTAVMISDITAPDTPDAPMLSADSDSGVSGDGITNDTTPTFTGTAEAGSMITLYDTDGTTVLGTAVARTDGSYTVTSSDLTDGEHMITVTATDDHGNVSDPSEAADVTIDTTTATPGAPTLAQGSDSGASTSDGITRFDTPTFTGTAEAGSTVTLYDTDGTTVLGTGTTDEDGTYTVTSSTLADGEHTITAKATDVAGNVSTVSQGSKITIDTAAPETPSAPTLTAATDTGSLHNDGITGNAAPTFTGSAEAGTTVTLYGEGRVVLGTANVGPSGTYSITLGTSQADGRHFVYAVSADTAGNRSTSSATYYTVDTTAPAAPGAPRLTAGSDSGRSASDRITSDTTPTFSGRAEAGSLVTLYAPDGTALGSATAGTNGTYTITTDDLADGTYSVTVRATDVAGNTSTDSPATSFTIDTSAPGAPSRPALAAVSDTGSLSNDGITSDTSPTFTGTAEAGSRVTLYDTDGTTALGSALVGSSGTWSVTASQLSDGSHTITAKATDAAGNISTVSQGRSVTIDTAAPAAPSRPTVTAATDTGSSQSDGITSDSTPTFSGTAAAGSTVTLYREGRVVVGTATVGSNGQYTITAGTALSDGRHLVYATASDAAGNVSSASSGTYMTVDTITPAPTVSGNGTTVSSAKQRVSGTGEAGSVVTVTDNGRTIGRANVGADGTWSRGITLSRGANNLVASDTDTAGNTGMSQAATITYTPPRAAASMTSLNSMVQAMATMTPKSSGALTPSTPPAQPEVHLAAAHA